MDTATIGKLITFEGLDGTGKSTQIQLLASALERLGIEVVATREPGGTRLGEEVRSILLDSRRSEIAPHAELALLFGCRAQLMHDVIEPALAAGRWVICDRFTDSSEAYQGVGRGLGCDAVHMLHKVLVKDYEPWMTVLLDGDLETSLGRARSRNDTPKQAGHADEGRFEAESDKFHQRVQAGFRTLAARESHRVIVVDARRPISAIHEDILTNLFRRLGPEAALLKELAPKPAA